MGRIFDNSGVGRCKIRTQLGLESTPMPSLRHRLGRHFYSLVSFAALLDHFTDLIGWSGIGEI